MPHKHAWSLVEVVTARDMTGTQIAGFVCTAPGCTQPPATLSCPADSYLAALAAHDAGLPGPWPPPVPDLPKESHEPA